MFLVIVRHKTRPYDFPIYEQSCEFRPSTELLQAAKELANKLSRDHTGKMRQFEVVIEA